MFSAAATSDQVRNTHGFDRDSWPCMGDRTWATTLHQDYGREAYRTSVGSSAELSPTGDIPSGGVAAPEAGAVKL